VNVVPVLPSFHTLKGDVLGGNLSAIIALTENSLISVRAHKFHGSEPTELIINWAIDQDGGDWLA